MAAAAVVLDRDRRRCRNGTATLRPRALPGAPGVELEVRDWYIRTPTVIVSYWTSRIDHRQSEQVSGQGSAADICNAVVPPRESMIY